VSAARNLPSPSAESWREGRGKGASGSPSPCSWYDHLDAAKWRVLKDVCESLRYLIRPVQTSDGTGGSLRLVGLEDEAGKAAAV